MDILEDASLKGAQPLFDKNKALSINEVADIYQNNTLKYYHECLNTDETPYIDEVINIYNEKREQLMMRRNAKHYENLEQALNDLHLSCYDNKKFKLIEKLRNKLSFRKSVARGQDP
jgi:hypothetical protein